MSIFENMDANTNIFFDRQLEAIKKKTYDIQYPELKSKMLIPVSHATNQGATSILYREFDKVGDAEIIANNALDLPRVSVLGKEYPSPIVQIGDSYGYTLKEIMAAQFAKQPLQPMLAAAARQAIEQKINKIAFFGDSKTAIPGFFTNPNITEVEIAADGTEDSKTFASKDADKILRDMNSLITIIQTSTLGIESPDTFLLPIEQHALINTTARSTTSDTTILQYFLRNNPQIKSVEWLNELKTAGTGGTTMMIAYRKSPDILELEIPMEFTQQPVQLKGLNFEVPCWAQIGGTIIYRPGSVAKGEGI